MDNIIFALQELGFALPPCSTRINGLDFKPTVKFITYSGRLQSAHLLRIKKTYRS